MKLKEIRFWILRTFPAACQLSCWLGYLSVSTKPSHPNSVSGFWFNSSRCVRTHFSAYMAQRHPDLPCLTSYPQTHTPPPSSLPHLPHFVLACRSSHPSHHQSSVIQPSSYLFPLLSPLQFWCWRKTDACGVGGLLYFAIDPLLSAGTTAWFTAPSVTHTHTPPHTRTHVQCETLRNYCPSSF